MQRSSGRWPNCWGPSTKQSEYGKVILPLTVIRRLDCVLEPTKQAVTEQHSQLGGKVENIG